MRVVVTFVSGTCDPGWVSLCGQFALRVNALQTSSLFQSDRFFLFFFAFGLVLLDEDCNRTHRLRTGK